MATIRALRPAASAMAASKATIAQSHPGRMMISATMLTRATTATVGNPAAQHFACSRLSMELGDAA